MAIYLTISGHTEIAVWLCALILSLGPIFSFKWLIAANKSIPALIITTEYIYFFQHKKTFLWGGIKSYGFRSGLLLFLILDIEFDTAYIKSMHFRNPVSRLHFILSNKMSLGLTLLKGDKKLIINKFDEYAGRS